MYEFTPEFLESVQRGEVHLVLDCLREVQGRMDKIEALQQAMIKAQNAHIAMLNGFNETLQAILSYVQPKPLEARFKPQGVMKSLGDVHSSLSGLAIRMDDHYAVLRRDLKQLKAKKRKKP